MSPLAGRGRPVARIPEEIGVGLYHALSGPMGPLVEPLTRPMVNAVEAIERKTELAQQLFHLRKELLPAIEFAERDFDAKEAGALAERLARAFENLEFGPLGVDLYHLTPPNRRRLSRENVVQRRGRDIAVAYFAPFIHGVALDEDRIGWQQRAIRRHA